MTLRFVVLSMLLSSVIAARADERRRAVVVPTELGGYFLSRDQYRREVNLALEERLRAAQFVVPSHSPLSPTEAECRDFGCLARIADMHAANLVVAGRIVNNQQVKVSYHLRVRIAENVSGQLATREREKECDNCTEPQARDQLATLMSAVIANEPETKPISVAPPAESPSPPSATSPGAEPKSPPPPAAPTTRDRFTRGERWALRVSGIALIGAGIGLFAQGFVEKSHDGDIVTQNGQQYRRDTTTTGQPLFFTLGTVSALSGLGLSLVGWIRWPVKVTPTVSSSSANLRVEGSF